MSVRESFSVLQKLDCTPVLIITSHCGTRVQIGQHASPCFSRQQPLQVPVVDSSRKCLSNSAASHSHGKSYSIEKMDGYVILE